MKCIRSLVFFLGCWLTGSAALADDNCQLGKERWYFDCSITSKDVAPDLTYLYSNVRRMKVCFNFNNKGGHNDDAAWIMHIHADGSKVSPFRWFNVVRFNGQYSKDQVSWTGSEFRLFPVSIRMEAVFHLGDREVTYIERMRNGGVTLSEVETKCIRAD